MRGCFRACVRLCIVTQRLLLGYRYPFTSTAALALRLLFGFVNRFVYDIGYRFGLYRLKLGCRWLGLWLLGLAVSVWVSRVGDMLPVVARAAWAAEDAGGGGGAGV